MPSEDGVTYGFEELVRLVYRIKKAHGVRVIASSTQSANGSSSIEG